MSNKCNWFSCQSYDVNENNNCKIFSDVTDCFRRSNDKDKTVSVPCLMCDAKVKLYKITGDTFLGTCIECDTEVKLTVGGE